MKLRPQGIIGDIVGSGKTPSIGIDWCNKRSESEHPEFNMNRDIVSHNHFIKCTIIQSTSSKSLYNPVVVPYNFCMAQTVSNQTNLKCLC